MQSGGNAVAGNFTYSANDQIVTFTPVNPLVANTSYTVSYSAQITDTTGNPLTNPNSFSFTTGTSSDTTPPSVVEVDPPNGTFGVGVNVAPRVVFSERLNPISVVSSSSELYNHGSVMLYNTASNQYVEATVSMSADRVTATITPNPPLQPNTTYQIVVGWYNGAPFCDVAGNCTFYYWWWYYGYYSSFVTGTGADTTHATVSTISPANGQTGVPLNAQITAVMSEGIDPTTVTNSSITVNALGRERHRRNGHAGQ